MLKRTLFMTAFASIAVSATSAMAWDDYSLIPLGDVDGGEFRSRAFDINDDGVIVGVGARDASPYDFVAVRWTNQFGYTPEILGGIEGKMTSRAQTINNSGMVSGFWVDGQVQSFAWDEVGGLNSYLEGGTISFSRSNSLTEGNTVLGWLTDDSTGYEYQGYAYDLNTSTLTTLGTLGGDISVAHGMNSLGTIVGSATTVPGDDDYRQAVTWTGGSFDPVALGGLDDFSHYEETRATRITDSGIILGTAGNRDADDVIFAQREIWMWDPDTQVADSLGFFAGYDWVAASDMTEDGSIVTGYAFNEGESSNQYLDKHIGLVWTEADGWIDANTLLAPGYEDYTVLHVKGINADGWLVGDALNPDGNIEAILLIPSPSSLVLLGLAGVSMVASRRRRLA